MPGCPSLLRSRTVRLEERAGGYDLSENGTIEVPVATTSEDIRTGLMHRTNVGNGMLFAFSTPTVPSFWMKNTLVPLDMEFLDEHLNLVDAHRNVQPGDLTPRRPKKEVCYVLERPAI